MYFSDFNANDLMYFNLPGWSRTSINSNHVLNVVACIKQKEFQHRIQPGIGTPFYVYLAGAVRYGLRDNTKCTTASPAITTALPINGAGWLM